jgi:hypothetical protein
MHHLPVLPTVRVEILHTRGCPHQTATAELVRGVAEDMGIPIRLHKTLIESEEQAIRLRFVGSPTVLVNGLDIVPEARHYGSYGLG